jgi:type III secretion protein V
MNVNIINRFLRQVSGRQDIAFAVILLLVIGMFVVPLPTLLVDIFIAFNITLAILVVATATYLKNVLELSTFPSLLLVSTIFRLALTISTTRLILTEADAGEIIASFGNFIIAGSVAVGMIVFFIITIVNFIVITKGAERIAEVSARFTLDALPGKQMAIDAELRNGDIDNEQAKRKRLALQQESQFFGSMDGAMRFIKGDAIAGLIIVFVNLLGGLMIGMLQDGLSFSEAASLYSLLSIGDGLVSQLPAILVAVAAGTVVTRVASEDAKDLGTDIGKQLATEPRALGIAAGAAFLLSALPGFPTIVFIMVGSALGAASYFLSKKAKEEELKKLQASKNPQEEELSEEIDPETGYPESHMMAVANLGDLFTVEVNEEVYDLWLKYNLRKHITKYTFPLRMRLGFIIPSITFDAKKDYEPKDKFLVLVEAVPEFKGKACVLDENGKPSVNEKLFEEIGQQLCQIMEKHAAKGFGLKEANQWLEFQETINGPLVQIVKQTVPILRLVNVMRILLAEGIIVSQPRIVMETLVQFAGVEKSDEMLADRVRTALKRQIVSSLCNDNNKIEVGLVAPDVEGYLQNLAKMGVMKARQDDKQMLRMLELFKETSQKLLDNDKKPVIVTLAGTRRFLRMLLEANKIQASVLSVEEVTGDVEVVPIQLISFNGEFGNQPAPQPGGQAGQQPAPATGPGGPPGSGGAAPRPPQRGPAGRPQAGGMPAGAPQPAGGGQQ